MQVKYLNEREYSELGCYEIFEKNNFSRGFALLENDEYFVKIAWRSDIIKPIFLELDSRHLAIGIDNDFVVINRNSLGIVVKLKLVSNFFSIVTNKKCFYAISELDVHKFNKVDLTMLSYKVMPDLIENWEKNGEQLKVFCSDGNDYIV